MELERLAIHHSLLLVHEKVYVLRLSILYANCGGTYCKDICIRRTWTAIDVWKNVSVWLLGNVVIYSNLLLSRPSRVEEELYIHVLVMPSNLKGLLFYFVFFQLKYRRLSAYMLLIMPSNKVWLYRKKIFLPWLMVYHWRPMEMKNAYQCCMQWTKHFVGNWRLVKHHCQKEQL